MICGNTGIGILFTLSIAQFAGTRKAGARRSPLESIALFALQRGRAVI